MGVTDSFPIHIAAMMMMTMIMMVAGVDYLNRLKSMCLRWHSRAIGAADGNINCHTHTQHIHWVRNG